IIVGTTEREKVIANLRELQIPIDRELSDLDNQLIEMTRNHARRNLQRRLLARKNRELPSDRVADLQTLLDLDIPPLIIDTFDVSTLMGTNNVGSCIRFVNGKPLKKGYTRFKVNTVMQQDDFASMEEIVYRRYHKVKNGVDSRGLPIPDLIVIDGGREQLKRAGISLDKLHLDIPHIGLAKREEEIYFANRMTPLNLDNSRPGILLLRACRDEAHRFAVSYQKQLRQKVGMESILDKIEGIGPKRKNQLLMKYKTVATLAKESSETVSSTIGISQKLASDVILACRNFITLEENRWKT
ncbi:MAG: helix-hairpin-helix domain-containing protein, partial [Candidatus Heimdallarchaeota archaeon]|nr:helix-hairpin-helix domain-containing protein [Candidatus Heimdallarchaeota archaeon]